MPAAELDDTLPAVESARDKQARASGVESGVGGGEADGGRRGCAAGGSLGSRTVLRLGGAITTPTNDMRRVPRAGRGGRVGYAPDGTGRGRGSIRARGAVAWRDRPTRKRESP